MYHIQIGQIGGSQCETRSRRHYQNKRKTHSSFLRGRSQKVSE